MKDEISRRLKKLRSDPRNLFYLISGAGILLYFAFSFRHGAAMYAWMVQENKPEIRFIDYFSHLDLTAIPSSLYQRIFWNDTASYAPVFPPLAYCMYRLLYRLTDARTGLVPGPDIETVPGTLSVFTLYLIFNALLFFVAIGMTGQRNRKKDLAIFTLLMLSAVYAGSGYMLGNSTMLVVALLMVGFRLLDSRSPAEREAGLLILAICVGLKLYPAVFGLVFLKKKQYRELIRFIVYSLVLLLVPFKFFGGKEGFDAWIANLTGPLQSAGDYGRPQYLRGLFFTMIRSMTGREEAMISTILSVVVCLLWGWLAWRSRSKNRTLFFLTCLMVFFPSGAYRYTLAYLTIPLVMLLKEAPREERKGWFIGAVSAMYGLLFTMPVWWLAVIPVDRRYDVPILTSVEIWLYLIAYTLAAVVTIAEMTGLRLKNRKGAEAWR